MLDPWLETHRDFQRHLHNIADTGAICLDGTPGGLYYSKGFGDGVNKTIVHFNGGGWCYGLDKDSVANDCFSRSLTNLGSTAPTVDRPWDPTDGFDGYFSGDANEDINFYNWNRFFFIYCDGTGHQGYIQDPLTLHDTKIYFRGTNITKAHINFVFNLLPPEYMDTFVVNGCSAGGLATFTWVDTIAEIIQAVNPAAKVFGLPDSGFFVDYPSLKTGKNDYAANIKAVVDLANHGEVPLPNAACMAENGATNPHYCMMAEHLVKYIKTPLIIEESLYDTW